MTINGIKTAANQKSNRSPQMDLREDQVEETLYELRQMGAVIEVHSGGRVPKFKHQLYEWLDVEKVELAVMAELLLRGEQTLGDLRARAARMDRIAGLNELKPIVASLIEKGLIIELTPPGRGQIVTHNLYQVDEVERLKAQHGEFQSGSMPHPTRRTDAGESEPDSRAVSPNAAAALDADDRVDLLVQEMAELKRTVESLQSQLAEIQELLS
jgi:uncharacterized protein YceH (UPF0502 family)